MREINTGLQILRESAILEGTMAGNIANRLNESEIQEFINYVGKLDQINEGVIDQFYEDAVNIYQDSDGKLLIENADFQKYMYANNIEDPSVALNNITEHYGIKPGDTYIVIESADDMVNILNILESAQRCGDVDVQESAKKLMKSTVGNVKKLVDNGIKCLTRKK